MRRRTRRIVLAVAVAALVAGAAAVRWLVPGSASRTRGGIAMGTLVEVTVAGPDDAPLDAWIDSAFAEIARIERNATDYDENSPVGHLNTVRAIRDPSRELVDLLIRSRELTRATDGAFDVTTGTATALWRRAEERGTPPTKRALDRAAGRIGPKNLIVDPRSRRIVLAKGTRIDLGGIAKGYAADRAIAVLARQKGFRGALVAAAGDIAVRGRPAGRTVWRIGIRHPRRGASEYFGVIELERGAVSTSGDYERGYEIGDSTYGHIFDPATARPARSGVVSATVIAPTAETADALATAAFVLGPRLAIEMLERIEGVDGLVMTEDAGRLVAYPTAGFLERAMIDTSKVRLAGREVRP